MGRCDFCVEDPIVIAMGIVNGILSILPVSIGLIGIHAEKRIKIFGGLSIFFLSLLLQFQTLWDLDGCHIYMEEDWQETL